MMQNSWFAARSIFDLLRHNKLLWTLHIVQRKIPYRLQAFRAGIHSHKSNPTNYFILRRNIHRIEKGIANTTRHEVFAEKYILQTTKALKQLCMKKGEQDISCQWGLAVLQEYFRVCKHTSKVQEAENLFSSITIEPENKFQLYNASERPPLTVEYDALHALAQRRRSVRKFLSTPVPFKEVQKAMKIAALSPSACNRQPFSFLYFDDPDLSKQIAQIAGGAQLQESNLPGIIVVVCQYRAFSEEYDMETPVIDSSLATMSFLLALETIGISSICINWPQLPHNEQRIRSIITLEPDECITLLIGIGYPHPDARILSSYKREVADLVYLNHYQSKI